MKKLMCLFALGVSLAGASTLTFSFSGQHSSIEATASGVGSVGFPDGLETVILPELTSFSYVGVTNFNDPYGPASQRTDDYGLADLTSFDLTLGPDGPMTFTLSTIPTADNPTGFVIFDPGGGSFVGGVWPVIAGPVLITSFEAAPAPEPVSFALLGMGMVAIGGWQKLARRHTPQPLIYAKAKP
jgi:hypothetical protein